MDANISIFSGERIRRVLDDKKEKWYFSVVDIISVLTGSSIPKKYLTDVADIETLFLSYPINVICYE